MKTSVYMIHAMTPLHLGTGQGHDLIDLPIARERPTSHPVIPGSSIKGVLRAVMSGRAEDEPSQGTETPPLAWRLFGPDSLNADKFASALRFSDARLVLLPVQSDLGTFAWVTSPMVLARLRRDMGGPWSHLKIPSPRQGDALIDMEGGLLDSAMRVQLAGVTFNAAPLHKKWLKAIPELLFSSDPTWSGFLHTRLAVLSDDSFTWLAQHQTEVRAHIRIDDQTGTVQRGALWYEESLPAESILLGLVQGAGNMHIGGAEALKVLKDLSGNTIQVGGGASTGLGIARFGLLGGAR